MADLSIAQLKALLAKKQKEKADYTKSEEYKQHVEEGTALLKELAPGHFVELLRGMCVLNGISLKAKGKRKGVSTGVTRASGDRKVNAYMLLLNEERRKLKLTGRKEPKEMTTNSKGKQAKKFLVDVSEGVWNYLKSTGLTSNSAVFQVDYQAWNEATPTENCTPYFAKWWNECADKDAYDIATDWETYYKGVDACVVDEGEAEVDALSAEAKVVAPKKKAPKKKKKAVAPKKKKKINVVEVCTAHEHGLLEHEGKTYNSIEELEADAGNDTDCGLMDDDEEDGSSDYSE